MYTSVCLQIAYKNYLSTSRSKMRADVGGHKENLLIKGGKSWQYLHELRYHARRVYSSLCWRRGGGFLLHDCVMVSVEYSYFSPHFNRVEFEAVRPCSGMLSVMLYSMRCLLHTGTGRRCVKNDRFVYALRSGGDSLPLSLQMA